MQKTLDLLRNDLEHFWPEILFSLLALAFHTGTDHYAWVNFGWSQISDASTVQSIATLLLPITWWLLITRAMQAQPTVGEEHLWLTRPFGWTRVLTAKLLFLALTVVLPYALCQALLLHEAHLPVLAVLGPLCVSVLQLCVFGFLLVMALAVLVNGASRAFFIALGLLLCWIVALFLANDHRRYIPMTPEPLWSFWTWLASPLICALIILVQYAQRRTLFARFLFAITALLVATAFVLGSNSQARRIGNRPAITDEAAPFTVTIAGLCKDLSPRDEDRLITNSDGDWNGGSCIALRFSGIPTGSEIIVNNVQINVASGGLRRLDEEGWNPRLGLRPIDSDNPYMVLPSSLGILENLAGQHATIRMRMIITDLVATETSTSTVTAQGFDLPYHGRCTLRPDGNWPFCSLPIDAPPHLNMTLTLHSNCATASSPELTIHGPLNGIHEPLSPVVSMLPADFWPNGFMYTVCPGSTAHFTTYRETTHRIVDANILDAAIPDAK